jgi:hypothetical protein
VITKGTSLNFIQLQTCPVPVDHKLRIVIARSVAVNRVRGLDAVNFSLTVRRLRSVSVPTT